MNWKQQSEEKGRLISISTIRVMKAMRQTSVTTCGVQGKCAFRFCLEHEKEEYFQRGD
jgi:hypothetical protein